MWYTYIKGWHNSRIPSQGFNNPNAYRSPQRDPAPSRSFYKDVDLNGGDGLLIDSRLLKNYLDTYPILLTKDLVSAVSSAEFVEADHKYFYSRTSQKKNGGLADNAYVRAGIAYLLDGVVDAHEIAKGVGIDAALKDHGLEWITKGSCEPGDVRVSFQVSTLPSELSLLGKQVGYPDPASRIVPQNYSQGDPVLMASANITTLENLLNLKQSRV